MNREELILVTGATGFLGVQLVHELLARYPDARLALLIRDRPGKSGQERADSIVPPSERSRVQVYSGDVGQANLGLDIATWQRLSEEATRVIHSAATVRFDHSLDEARRINVEGTRRVLDFAAGASRRPSIIVGDSRTGVTSSFKMMYWPLKIYARRLWRTVPGYPDAVLDIVPVDFVATAVARLVFDSAAIGSTVHLCAGPHGSATIQQIARRAMKYFNAPEPRYVDPKLFFALLRPLLFIALWGRKRRVLRDGR